MTVEEAGLTPEHPPAASALPDIENLADSDDADVIEARANLLEAQATLMKASTPLFDKIVIRGLIPIALAIVGPWALLKFDASQVEQKKQGQVIVELQELLEAAKGEAASRQRRSAAWRSRMKNIEEEKAVELTAMVTMVCRLDDMMKSALIQQAVLRVLDARVRGPSGAAPQLPDREQVVRDVTEQIQLPGVAPDEVKNLVGQQYDRISKTRK